MNQPIIGIFRELAGSKVYVSEDAVLAFYQRSAGVSIDPVLFAKVRQIANIENQISVSDFLQLSHVFLNYNGNPMLALFYAADSRQELKIKVEQMTKALSSIGITLTEQARQYFRDNYSADGVYFSPAAFLEILTAIQGTRQ